MKLKVHHVSRAALPIVIISLILTIVLWLIPDIEYNNSLVLWPTQYNNTRILRTIDGCDDIIAEVTYFHPSLSCQPWIVIFNHCGPYQNGTAWLGDDGCPVEPKLIGWQCALVSLEIFLILILFVVTSKPLPSPSHSHSQDG